MMQARPGGGIDKRFKYFLTVSFLIHALFLSYIFVYQRLGPQAPVSIITINLGMPGGGTKNETVKRAPLIVHKEESKMVIPEKTIEQKKPAEKQEQASSATATTQESSVSGGGSGGGHGTGEGAVQSNELDNQPSLVNFSNPVYPVEARKEGIEGVVLLKALIAPDGRIKDVKVLKSISVLDSSAVNAVKQWRFTAITSHGKPVYVWMIIPIRFQLK